MRRAVIARWAFALALLGSFIQQGHAEKRVALVVGNDLYANLPADQQLRRAVNDARAVGVTLGRLGFTVLRGENLNRQALNDKLDEMAGQLGPGDTAFFFFAGHGVSIGGGNYILPTDVPNVTPGQEARLARAALGENDIVSDLQGRGVRVAVVVLDACRNNPFRRPGTRATGGERGLVRSDPVRGVFSLYSAGVGQTALDRLGDADTSPNSVFTRVLVPVLGKPGLDLSTLAIEVREEVARLAGTIGHDQRPAYYDETVGGRIYLAGLPPAGAQAPAVTQPMVAEAERAWAASRDTSSIAVLEEFVRRYADSYYAVLARARIEELKRSPAGGVLSITPSIASGRLIREYKGHTEYVSSVAFSPDGRSIASGAGDNTVRVWSSESDSLIRELKGHSASVVSVAFMPDGRRILSGSVDQTTRIWDAQSGRALHILKGHSSWARSVVASSDGRYALSGSHDRTLRLWNADTGAFVRVFEGHTKDIKSVAFSPDGRRIVSGGEDRVLRLWSTESGSLIRELRPNLVGDHQVFAVAFSPDGKRVLSGNSDKTIQVLDVESGEIVRTIRAEGAVYAAKFSPDGRFIAAGGEDKTLYVWDADSGRELRRLSGHSELISSIAYAPDGQQILTGSHDRTVRLWDTGIDRGTAAGAAARPR